MTSSACFVEAERSKYRANASELISVDMTFRANEIFVLLRKMFLQMIAVRERDASRLRSRIVIEFRVAIR